MVLQCIQFQRVQWLSVETLQRHLIYTLTDSNIFSLAKLSIGMINTQPRVKQQFDTMLHGYNATKHARRRKALCFLEVIVLETLINVKAKLLSNILDTLSKIKLCFTTKQQLTPK